MNQLDKDKKTYLKGNNLRKFGPKFTWPSLGTIRYVKI